MTSKEYYNKNKEKILAQVKANAAKNKEKILEYQKQYREKTKK